MALAPPTVQRMPARCPENEPLGQHPLIGDRHVEIQPLQPFHEVSSDGVARAFLAVRRPEVAVGVPVAKQDVHDGQDRVRRPPALPCCVRSVATVLVLCAQVRLPGPADRLGSLGQRSPEPLVPQPGRPPLRLPALS